RMIFEARAPQRPSAAVVTFRDQLEEASARAHASRTEGEPATRAAAAPTTAPATAPANPAAPPAAAPARDGQDWRDQPLNVPATRDRSPAPAQQGFQPVEPEGDRVRSEPLP